MLYDGGARQVRPDGSIEIRGKRRIVTGAIVALFVVSLMVGMALVHQWPDLFPVLFGLWVLVATTLPRTTTRRVIFDASAKALHILDRGRCKGDRSIAFSDIRALTVEQREPRRVANALPVLIVNGAELLSVEDAPANANLERELQTLVGLPLQPSPKDTSGWSGC